MKMELFPNFAGIQKYIINGDRFDEIEYDSNYAALVEFINLKFGFVAQSESEVCQKVKDIILNREKFDELLQFCDFNLYESIIFLSQINSKKIFTSKIVQCLKEYHGKTRRKQNSSGVRLERSKKNKGSARKAPKSRKLSKS
jgi:hypothetical protein